MWRFKSYQASNFFLPGLIIILPFVLFWRWLFKGEVLFWGTLLLQFWPWRYLVKMDLLNGQWPLWNPWLGNGAPLLANMQSAVFYPPNLIALLLPIEHALTLSVIIHLPLAGLFMYLYTRRLGLAPFAATVSALSYMFSGYIIGRTQFIAMVNAAAWFPLLLLLSDKIASRTTPLRLKLLNALGLALVLAIQLLAGHAQLWFYGLWLIGFYIFFKSLSFRRGAPHPTRLAPGFKLLLLSLFLLALAVSLAILLAAVQILPTIEFVRASSRNEGAGRTFALTYSFWPWRLVTLLAPDFFGNPAQGNYWGYSNYWEDHAYVGILPFIFALAAIWQYAKAKFWGRKPWSGKNSTALGSFTIKLPQPLQAVPFFAGLAPISLLLALGWNTPVYPWVFDTIPGFSFFQGPARLLIWYTLALAVLAGIGAQYFESKPEGRPNWRRFLAGCVAITLAASLLALLGQSALTNRASTFLTATRTLGILLTLSVTLLLIRPEKDQSRPDPIVSSSTSEAEEEDPPLLISDEKQKVIPSETLWHGIVITFVAVDLLLAAMPLIPMISPAVFNHSIASAEFLKSRPGDYRFYVNDDFAYQATFDRYFRFKAFGPAEVEYWQGFKELLAPNFGVYAGLPSANNNDPLVVGNWQRLTDQLEHGDNFLRARLLALMSVGYFISGVEAQSWPTIYTTEQVAIQRVPDPLPRAYFAPRAYYAKTREEALARLTAPDFDSHQEVVIMNTEKGEASPGNASPASASWSIALQELNHNQLQLEVNTPTSGFVVLTDTFYPGWQAAINDQPRPIRQANLGFRAVAVEAGSHQVTFSYLPRAFTFGLWTSIISWLIMIVTIIYLILKT
jgi:hypothetical protein